MNLEAKLATYAFVPGGPTTVWAYNGLVPGPIIRANVGTPRVSYADAA